MEIKNQSISIVTLLNYFIQGHKKYNTVILIHKKQLPAILFLKKKLIAFIKIWVNTVFVVLFKYLTQS